MTTVKTLAGQPPHACVNEIWKYGDSEGPYSLLLLPSLRLATTKKQELLKNYNTMTVFFFQFSQLKSKYFLHINAFYSNFQKKLSIKSNQMYKGIINANFTGCYAINLIS